jgi:hypothetical protein
MTFVHWTFFVQMFLLLVLFVAEFPLFSFAQVQMRNKKDVLKRQGITKLYHFTDERNVQSIMECGLLSWCALDEQKMAVVCGGDELSRELDEKKNLQDYVRLSFAQKHPMKMAE